MDTRVHLAVLLLLVLVALMALTVVAVVVVVMREQYSFEQLLLTHVKHELVEMRTPFAAPGDGRASRPSAAVVTAVVE